MSGHRHVDRTIASDIRVRSGRRRGHSKRKREPPVRVPEQIKRRAAVIGIIVGGVVG
jgi:hypothetical protein